MYTQNFIILAAGRGSRVGRIGDTLHKSLLPLEGQAIISHQFDLAPEMSKIIVVVGFLAEQVIGYVGMAHPDLDVQFVYLDDWEIGGPAYSLFSGMSVADKTLPTVFTTCDTLWEKDLALWDSYEVSWAGVASAPIGTTGIRWMMLETTYDSHVLRVQDKSLHQLVGRVWTGLGMISSADYDAFTSAIKSIGVWNERSVGLGFSALGSKMKVSEIRWTDVGDEDAYRAAVVERSGYDWTKVGQATYILPNSGRVIKFFEDEADVVRIIARTSALGSDSAKILVADKTMFAQPFISGGNIYQTATADNIYQLINSVLHPHGGLWAPVDVHPVTARIHATEFYRAKTMSRISQLRPELRSRLDGIDSRIPWSRIIDGVTPVTFHGDYTFANIMASAGGFTAIDIRPAFISTSWGDMQYDLAKLLSSTMVNWHDASHGKFETWELADVAYVAIMDELQMMEVDLYSIKVLAALCLINSAPLHSAPFDEVLVARGTRALEELL